MNKEAIQAKLTRLVPENFGEDFKFRPGQLEAVVDILDTYFNTDIDTYILEAPTGSGKSLIAMICSLFLKDSNLRGYILTSEVALQDQYMRDFQKYHLDWGSVKGGDTYTCAVNSLPFSLGECRIAKLSYEQAESLDCWPHCGYLTNRKKSIESEVSLLNYSYALIQRNYVESQQQSKGFGVPFPQRDFAFCDEAHKVPDIVQSHFSPCINQEFMDSLKFLEAFQKKLKIGGEVIYSNIKSIVFLLQEEEHKEFIHDYLKKLYRYLVKQRHKDGVMMESAKNLSWTEMSADWKRAVVCVDKVKDVYCKIEDYLEIIKNGSVNKLVKDVVKSEKAIPTITFNYVDESAVVLQHFMRKLGFKVMMSATIGEPRSYLAMLGTQNARYNRIASVFSYQKSPIYFTHKNRINQKNVQEKIPLLAEYLRRIMDKHPRVSGVVHTGSYWLGQQVWEQLPSKHQGRIRLYGGTQEKINALSYLEDSNTLVMGPSLLEGIDLREDLSRLQVFLKVPYPGISNNLTREKMKHYPNWYKWKTEISVRQGVGRSVRSEEDWAVTYFLDGCLSDLTLPEEFTQRIIKIEEVEDSVPGRLFS